MASRFQWILNCADDNTSFTLTQDPIGWDECNFTLTRHSAYHGLFNQFTSSLKWHSKGGGKQFIDDKYNKYDIDGRIYITINIDADGGGKNYELLFNGRLNLASYSEDGTYTTVNIETSDIVTKLNSRADIPVPLNTVRVYVPGQGLYQAVIIDSYNPADNNNETSGTFTFDNPFITAINVFVATTIDTDTGNALISSSVTFTGTSVAGNTGTSGSTTLQITAEANGQLTITFTNLLTPVMLYLKGQQLSLGQKSITPAETITLMLPGITIPYESQFSILGTNRNGPPYTINDSSIINNCTITVTSKDVQGNEISDTVIFTGNSISGSGASSNNSTLQITGCAVGSVTIAYANLTDIFGLWINGNPITTYDPGTGGHAIVDISYSELNSPPNGVTLQDGFEWGGFVQFDAQVIFDNLDAFVFAASNDVSGPAHAGGGTAIIGLDHSDVTSIFAGIDDPIIQYPLNCKYNIQIAGTFTELIGGTTSIDHFCHYGIWLSTGKSITDPDRVDRLLWGQSPYAGVGDKAELFTGGTNVFNISINAQGTINLAAGEQVFLFARIYMELLEGGATTYTDLGFKFDITSSNIDFKILENAQPTPCVSVMIHEAFNQVVDSIADSDGNFYSEFYGRTDSAKRSYAQNGDGSGRAITSGLCIRGHFDKIISTSLNDLFTSMQAIDNIGLEVDINNRVRVERLKYFYDPTTKILSLPNVPNYTRANENSFYYNQVEIGYTDFATEIFFKNGLDEIHAGRNYATRVGTARGSIIQNYGDNPTGTLQNKLTRTSKLIAGNEAIELTRRKNLKWSTDDFKYDNNNFIICASKSITCAMTFTEFGLPPGILIPGILPVSVGDTFTISGSAHNNYTFTVLAVAFTYSDGINDSSTYITPVPGNLYDEVCPSCTISITGKGLATTARFTLAADIQNVFNAVFSRDWLNMAITPARMLQNSFNVIVAGLQKIQGNIQFLTGSGNYNAITKLPNTGKQEDYTGQPLSESASLDYADKNVRNVTPLWKPEIFMFETVISYAQFKAARANPNGYVEWYKFPDQIWRGFLRSMTYNLKTGNAKFELISLPDTNDAQLLDEFNSIITTE